ncbi:hypothetical protein DE146DRAFT_51177 [Phaeosphaeria sp. MPI-PUGE-AT-0046c]|nr:hypothetical protein DE146DRAFT_51177 [Phaeosphaeria sp. MPI-PUGE-AT-0046c]
MRLKILNGAPSPQQLSFAEESLLAPGACNLSDAASPGTLPSDSAISLKWRRIQTNGTRLRTGWSQPYLPGGGVPLEEAEADMTLSLPQIEQSSIFLGEGPSRADTFLDFTEPPTEVDNFLEQSLAFHDTLLSSQVAQDVGPEDTISSSSFLTTSFHTTLSDLTSSSSTHHTSTVQVSAKTAITPLHVLPTARHLRSIYPQTPTPNFVCVLTTQPAHREVVTRKGGHRMNLCEILVADESASGFKVTFWLRPPRGSNAEQNTVQQNLLSTLETLKVGDILLLRNIALTSFRDAVYGQSLNPSIARARTNIDVLLRSGGAPAVQLDSLPNAFTEKLNRVKKWARTHVAMTDGGTRKRRGTSTEHRRSSRRRPASSTNDESLPPDTMDSI